MNKKPIAKQAEVSFETSARQVGIGRWLKLRLWSCMEWPIFIFGCDVEV
jgi:hypothetical protein